MDFALCSTEFAYTSSVQFKSRMNVMMASSRFKIDNAAVAAAAKLKRHCYQIQRNKRHFSKEQKYCAFQNFRCFSRLLVNVRVIAFVSGVGGMRFKSRAGQIGFSVANGSPPLKQFFEKSSLAGKRIDSLHASA